jgi:hypothetical protein
MKKIIFAILMMFSVAEISAATIIIEGKYQNKNLFVQNFIGNNGVGFCAQEVKVNGQITTDETNSSAFEIDLSVHKLKLGDQVVIEIVHKDGCAPKVLNIDDLKPKPTFEMQMMNINEDGLLKWTTKSETGSLPYIIETFKWNKWIPVGEINGKGTPEVNEYAFKLVLHSGENKFRIKQKGAAGAVRYSKEITVSSKVNKPSFAVAKNKSIDFTSETAYEVYDAYGMVVIKGFGKNITTENLKKGQYYLCYDNYIADFNR